MATAKKMSPTELLSQLLKGNGLKLDREAIIEVINSLGEVGFNAARIARIIKGDEAEITKFREFLTELSKDNAALRQVAELNTRRVEEGLKPKKNSDHQGQKSSSEKRDRPKRRRTEAGPRMKAVEKPQPSVSILDIATQDALDPMGAILRGPRPF